MPESDALGRSAAAPAPSGVLAAAPDPFDPPGDELCALPRGRRSPALPSAKPFTSPEPSWREGDDPFRDVVDRAPDPNDACFVATDNLARAERAVGRGGGPAPADPWGGATEPRYLDRIDAHLHLRPDERARLRRNGFVVLDRFAYDNYANAFHGVFQEQLPLSVGIDPISHAVFRGTELALERVERRRLRPALDALLTKLRSALRASRGRYDADTLADLDVYLGVVRALAGEGAGPGGAAGAAGRGAARRPEPRSLFGHDRRPRRLPAARRRAAGGVRRAGRVGRRARRRVRHVAAGAARPRRPAPRRRAVVPAPRGPRRRAPELGPRRRRAAAPHVRAARRPGLRRVRLREPRRVRRAAARRLRRAARPRARPRRPRRRLRPPAGRARGPARDRGDRDLGRRARRGPAAPARHGGRAPAGGRPRRSRLGRAVDLDRLALRPVRRPRDRRHRLGRLRRRLLHPDERRRRRLPGRRGPAPRRVRRRRGRRAARHEWGRSPRATRPSRPSTAGTSTTTRPSRTPPSGPRSATATRRPPPPALGLAGKIARCPGAGAEWRVVLRAARPLGPVTVTLLDHHGDPLVTPLTLDVVAGTNVFPFDLPPAFAETRFGVEALHVRVADLALAGAGEGAYDYVTSPSAFGEDTARTPDARPRGLKPFSLGGDANRRP